MPEDVLLTDDEWFGIVEALRLDENARYAICRAQLKKVVEWMDGHIIDFDESKLPFPAQFCSNNWHNLRRVAGLEE